VKYPTVDGVFVLLSAAAIGTSAQPGNDAHRGAGIKVGHHTTPGDRPAAP
jgi:hypothetical protein